VRDTGLRDYLTVLGVEIKQGYVFLLFLKIDLHIIQKVSTRILKNNQDTRTTRRFIFIPESGKN